MPRCTVAVAAWLASCLLVAGWPLSAQTEPPVAGHDWPAFLGPTGDAKSAETIRTDWPASGPPVLWFRPAGEGYSAPTVAGGKVFVFDRVGDEARLTARDAAGGDELWSRSYPSHYVDMYRYSGGPRAAPVVSGNRVFAYGVDGRLRAHGVADGEVLWDVDTMARYGVVQNFFGVGSAPVVHGDSLIVMVGGSPAGSPSISSGQVEPDGSALVAFDLATGEERWRSGDHLASYATPRIADVAGHTLGLAFVRGGLMAFDPANGHQHFFFPWRANKLESVNAATPVVVGDTVLITESYGPGGVLLKVAADGEARTLRPEVVWQDPPRDKSLECHWSTPIHHQGYVYASSGQSSGEAQLRAVEHATGKVAWSEPGLGRATLTYADGHLLVLTETGRLLLVAADPERYRKVAEMDLGGGDAPTNESAKTQDGAADVAGPRLRFPAWNAPVLAHGRLYLRGKDQIVVLDVSP